MVKQYFFFIFLFFFLIACNIAHFHLYWTSVFFSFDCTAQRTFSCLIFQKLWAHRCTYQTEVRGFVFSVLHCINTEFWLPIFVHLVPWMSLLQFFAISICLFCCDWCYMLTTFATFLIFPCQLWTKYWAHLMWFHPCLSCVMENYNLFCDFYLSTCLIPVKSCYSLAI